MHVCMHMYVYVYVYVYVRVYAHVHVSVNDIFANGLTVARELYTCGIAVV